MKEYLVLLKPRQLTFKCLPSIFLRMVMNVMTHILM
jgi:hypothetical protein